MGHFMAIQNGEIDHFFVVLGVLKMAVRSNDLLGLNWTEKSSSTHLVFITASNTD